MSNRSCFGVLMALFVVLFAVLAVAPREPATWAMENAVAVLFVIGLGDAPLVPVLAQRLPDDVLVSGAA